MQASLRGQHINNANSVHKRPDGGTDHRLEMYQICVRMYNAVCEANEWPWREDACPNTRGSCHDDDGVLVNTD